MARRVLGAFAVTATAALATLVLATPASAHIPKWDAKCDEGAKVTKVWVNLNAYADKGNTVVVKDGDKELVNTKFGRDFSQNWDKLDATVDHTFTIKVTASDGARFNFEDKRTVKPCVKTPPTSTTKPVKPPVPPTVTSPEAPSSSETPPSTTTTDPGRPGSRWQHAGTAARGDRCVPAVAAALGSGARGRRCRHPALHAPPPRVN